MKSAVACDVTGSNFHHTSGLFVGSSGERMLPARFTQCSRAVASSSSAHTAPARLHTSAILHASYRSRKSRVAEKVNVEKRAERERLAALNRPHVVLGNRPGDESKWLNCDLSKIIITEEQILATPLSQPIQSQTQAQGQLELPKFMNYGVGEKEKELLFETLPALTVEATHLRAAGSGQLVPSYMHELSTKADAKELRKASQLATLVDLRNANAGGISYENRKRIVAAFSPPGKDGDTGRPEVQAAILTYQIRNLWNHLSNFKKDIANRRSLRRLVHQRAKILKYLKRVDRDRYDVVLDRLGLEPGSVEGELVV
ncbi:hypothetical protein NLI96_g1879 [Meripilus lineatus]|uniref:S15/NS1 RNA-binding domain-containing protein n=1 Tax=Meripilus lineatus TaxID=2056292 RepID=A0AAD5V9L6_9APHY|nr:hypothetical protein NLI96_g1879 [Physisporinus lineatus]